MIKLNKIILFSFFCVFNLQAQKQDNEKEKLNEIRINLLYLPFLFGNIDYQRILNKNISVGLFFGGTFRFKDTQEHLFPLPHTMVLTPYFRYYPFSKEKATGFFLEPNMSMSYYPLVYENSSGQIKRYNPYNKGFGFAIGYKNLIKSNNIFTEFLIGSGVALTTSAGAYPRIGFLIGKRF